MDAFKSNYNPNLKCWSNAKYTPIPESNSALGLLLINSLANNADDKFQINHETGYEMSRREVRLKSLRIAENLRKQAGIRSGDLVQVIGRTSDNMASLIIGLFAAGATVNPIDITCSAKEFSHFFQLVTSKMIICDEDIIEKVQNSLKAIGQKATLYVITKTGQIKEFNSVADDIIAGYETTTFMPSEVADLENSVPVIMCTSGSTGLPKGVQYSNKHFDLNHLQSKDW